MSKRYTVSQVAELCHLTVRALHHYDAMGLLTPTQRSAAGYRLYSEADLVRLQQILLFRELGFSLEDVKSVVDAPASERRTALIEHRHVLIKQREHTDSVLRALDTSIQLLEDTSMDTEHLFENFDKFENGEYAKEAEQRWGESAAWKQSKQRTKNYSKQDWASIQTETERINVDFLQAFKSGAAASSEIAMAIAERHRLHIDRWFYACSAQMHLNVTAMYVSDERFQNYYDRHAPGLAAYIVEAAKHNAQR